jgi:hypothetical protein
MKIKLYFGSALLMLISALMICADVAPPKGYLRIDVGIVLETRDDLGKYRFFLVSSDLVRPLTLKKGEKTFVGALGGGARYGSGTIVAIPSKSLSKFGDDPTPEKIIEMKAAIADDTVAGTIKLITHSFRRDVREAEAVTVSDAVYRIDKTPTGVTAVPISGVVPPAASTPAPAAGVNDGVTPGAHVATGLLMSLSLVTFGLFLCKRTRKVRA